MNKTRVGREGDKSEQVTREFNVKGAVTVIVSRKLRTCRWRSIYYLHS